MLVHQYGLYNVAVLPCPEESSAVEPLPSVILHRAAKPAALLNLMCFAAGGGVFDAMSTSEESLQRTLEPAGWVITDLRQVHYAASADAEQLMKQLGMQADFTHDEAGRLQLPVWRLQAHRT